MKLVTIVGARPQFIKASMLSRQIKLEPDISEVIIHTGQHFDERMSSIFFEELHIPQPDYNLGINQMTHGAMTGRMIEKIEEILMIENPDWVLVYGDTNSTLAGALAAKKLHIKVAHIEAGLRSHNMRMPEEINRILTDRISDLLLCPTTKAVDNLEQEGFRNFNCEIAIVGDVMLDSTLTFMEMAKRQSDILDKLKLDGPFVLCTVHREENTNDRNKLQDIFYALAEISKEVTVVCPLHPRTQSLLESFSLDEQIRIIEPVGYLDMQLLLAKCELVMTDSGGLQKEAFFHQKKCFTLRDETEWAELVECNANEVVGSESEKIMAALDRFRSQVNWEFPSYDFYGDGNASEKIVNALMGDY